MPAWWFFDKILMLNRMRAITMNAVPTITCSPWKPVARKNVAPNTESAKE